MATGTAHPLEVLERADAVEAVAAYPPDSEEVLADVAQDAVRLLAEVCVSRVRAAREAVKARDQVLGVVAHDLRNPLNTIVTSTDLLLELPLSETQRAHHLEVILRSAKRMDRLIQDLLDVARLEAAQLNLQLEVIPAIDIVRDAMEMHATRAAARSQAFRLSADADLPAIRADRHRLMQALSNLLDNAIKFTPEGGSIDVACRSHDGAVYVSVEDDGPGIPPEDLPVLFASFWQGRRSSLEGTGLGLAITRGVIEAHGGTITCENRKQGGVCFVFSIPVAAPEPQPSGFEQRGEA